jgi:hypothetical protein
MDDAADGSLSAELVIPLSGPADGTRFMAAFC